jgi:hypothetical protein
MLTMEPWRLIVDSRRFTFECGGGLVDLESHPVAIDALLEH